MKKDFYIGLDLGTDSLGWAATDTDYNFLRLKGKTAWGSRIFEGAKSKKERRVYRSSRRRKERQKYRIQLLNSLFAEEINKVDKTFFLRLENANLHMEDKDKSIDSKYLFKSIEEEKLFYDKYPTIWHLRRDLINGDSFALSDLRYVYLAIHHIIKYRGNFLKEGETNYNNVTEEVIERINNCLSLLAENIEDESSSLSKAKLTELKNILLDKNLNKTAKQKKIIELFDVVSCKEYITMFATIVTGGNYKLSKIDKALEESINFTENFEEMEEQIAHDLGDAFELVKCAKELYDFASLKELMGNEKYISFVMANIYEEHKEDLATLKKFIKAFDKSKSLSGKDRLYDLIFINEGNNNYDALKKVITEIDESNGLSGKDSLHDLLFKKEEKNNYAALVGVNSKNKKIKLEDFNKVIEKILENNKEIIEPSNYKKLDEKVKARQLLRTIAHNSTSLIPHQVHLIELKEILKNAEKKYPFIKNISEKIITLFKFRVPYYYGPLDSRSEFAWVERKSNEKITPWNISEIVDDNATKERFIKRLTNNCTYLLGEKVLPKVSLIFEEFMIRDRLNTMILNGALLTNETKSLIYEYIISRNKTTVAQIKSFLKNKTATKENDITISGIKEDVPFEATSHATLGKLFDLKHDFDKVEHLIFLATIYADDKKSFKTLLTNSKDLSKEQIKAILNLPTKKWAPLSEKLLCGISYVDDNGIAMSILDVMRETNQNFQMVYNNKDYGFKALVDMHNNEITGNLSTNQKIAMILEDTPTLTKRSINQALLVLDDIVKASGNNPKKIFIETTRENDAKSKGKEKDKRYVELKRLISKDIEIISKENKKELLNELELNQANVKGRHLYLYFKQMGLDMYTGEKINIEDVFDSTKYDLDHIVPQSLIKDDSLDNLVLVNRLANQRIKGSQYPLPRELKTDKVIKTWQYLHKIGAISDKKYNSLMRTSEITLEEIEVFVNRQINVVDYANITLRNVLKIKYPDTQLIFSKAQYPALLRQELNIAKNRDINDAHHAVDAYLNVVAGNELTMKFSNVRRIYAERSNKEDKDSRSFNMDGYLKNFVKKLDKNGVTYAEKIKKNALRHDALVTFKVDYQNGALYNATIYRKANDSNLIPIHTNGPLADVSKYGGYSDLSQAYIVAIEYNIGKKRFKSLSRVPLLYIKLYGNNNETLWKKVIGNDLASDIRVIKRIYLNQKIKYENCIYLLYTSDEIRNNYKLAYQSYLDNELLDYVNKSLSIAEKIIDCNETSFSMKTNKNDGCFEVSKNKNMKVFMALKDIYAQSIFESCSFIVRARNMMCDKFESLTLYEQIMTIKNMIILLNRKSVNAKFNSVFAEMKTNLMRPSKNIKTGQNITLIYESPSGLYKHEEKI